MSKKPTVLMILDGFGLNDKTEGNAVAQAKKPNIDALMREYPFVKGNASGLAVGLPDGQMGNSEVGHLNMGAGRIVYQELTRITKEINDGEFEGEQFRSAFIRTSFGWRRTQPYYTSVRSARACEETGRKECIRTLLPGRT